MRRNSRAFLTKRFFCDLDDDFLTFAEQVGDRRQTCFFRARLLFNRRFRSRGRLLFSMAIAIASAAAAHSARTTMLVSIALLANAGNRGTSCFLYFVNIRIADDGL